MLVHLVISDMAIISETTLEFEQGLNVVTGETGAGKSIVVGALNLVLGDRAKGSLIRHETEKAEVQALFRVPAEGVVAQRLRALELCSVDPDADEVDLVIRRIISRSGRNRVWINGVLATVRTLSEVTHQLVDISSQHEHASLMAARTHLDLLDRFGGLEAPLKVYEGIWAQLKQCEAELVALQARQAEKLQREDFLRFQLDEIDQLNLEPEEEKTLPQRREILRHAERLRHGISKAQRLLTSSANGAQGSLVEAAKQVQDLALLDEALQAYVTRLDAARIEIEDIAFELAQYESTIEHNPSELEAIETRLHSLTRLGRKYGLDALGLIDKASLLRDDLDALEHLDEVIEATQAKRTQLNDEAHAAAQTLRAGRRSAAQELSEALGSQLSDLAMAGADIHFELSEREALGPRGLDAGQLMIETNRGEGFKPLAKIASGGELSRLLLALKTVLVDLDEVQTGVFDEVDTGVGGGIAEVIGRKLSDVASHRQVIAITHLPHIAAQGRHHLFVRKQSVDGRTQTSVSQLTSAERLEELARMLGGVEITDRTRAHAAELLQAGR